MAEIGSAAAVQGIQVKSPEEIPHREDRVWDHGHHDHTTPPLAIPCLPLLSSPGRQLSPVFLVTANNYKGQKVRDTRHAPVVCGLIKYNSIYLYIMNLL